MYKRIFLSITLLVLLTLAKAHEFWIQPTKFFYKAGEKLIVSFKVGENFMGQPWDLKRDRIETFQLHQFTKTTNLLDSLKEGKQDNLSYTLKEEETHLVAMQSTNAFVEMSGEDFNTYLKEDGLDDILEHRKNTNTLTTPAKEFYSRHTKLLVQVGEKNADVFKKILGFPVEVVPEKNPYTLKVGDPIRFKILFDGKPMFGVRTKVWNRFDNRTTIQNIYTEKDGTFEVRISNPGHWMVTVVRMVPSKDPMAEWQSYWGSLIFGIK